MQRRNYAGSNDLVAMQRAVQQTWTPRSLWHVGDLAWGRNSIPNLEASWQTSLWVHDDTVAAWGWIDSPGNLELYVDPAHVELAAEVLEWFEEITTAGPDCTITIMETDARLAALLECSAYEPRTHAPYFLHCIVNLDDALPTPQLPEGYRLRTTRKDEANERAAAHRAAWRPGRIGEMLVPPVDLGDAASAVTTESYQAVMDAWPYRHDLDIVVEAPDGALVASALGWLDDVNQVAELEPVGTDPRHARRGLATAVSLSCLQALRQTGATRAVVYPRGDDAYPVARQLYFGLGFQPVARTITYGRSPGPKRNNAAE
jgi:GNAT superfamily N-acetyltransferase